MSILLLKRLGRDHIRGSPAKTARFLSPTPPPPKKTSRGVIAGHNKRPLPPHGSSEQANRGHPRPANTSHRHTHQRACWAKAGMSAVAMSCIQPFDWVAVAARARTTSGPW